MDVAESKRNVWRTAEDIEKFVPECRRSRFCVVNVRMGYGGVCLSVVWLRIVVEDFVQEPKGIRVLVCLVQVVKVIPNQLVDGLDRFGGIVRVNLWAYGWKAPEKEPAINEDRNTGHGNSLLSDAEKSPKGSALLVIANPACRMGVRRTAMGRMTRSMGQRLADVNHHATPVLVPRACNFS